MIAWVVLDVGEVLVDETRGWSAWAAALGVSPMTLGAGLEATIARGLAHREVFALLGFPDWRSRRDAVEAAYGGFRAADLYPDALPCVRALQARGIKVAIVANQPAVRTTQLRDLGFAPDVIAMSGELGVEKPDPAFFDRVLQLLGGPDPSRVAYVGDRIDNDVEPARRAGMAAVWVRRGPWGRLQQDTNAAATLVVDSLDAFIARFDELG